MWPNQQFPVDLVTFTEEIFNGKLHFLCSGKGQGRIFWNVSAIFILLKATKHEVTTTILDEVIVVLTENKTKIVQTNKWKIKKVKIELKISKTKNKNNKQQQISPTLTLWLNVLCLTPCPTLNVPCISKSSV